MITVIAADDHPMMLSGIEAFLIKSDFCIVALANSGADVLKLLAKTGPDILLMDVNMPNLGGLDVLRILREQGDERRLVLLTASLDDYTLLEALRLRVNGIVLKDGAQSVLLECLNEVAAGGAWFDRGLLERAVRAEGGESRRRGTASVNLAPREREIVALIAEGLRNRDIASELGISEGTVKVYLHRLYERTGVSNRTELALRLRETCNI